MHLLTLFLICRCEERTQPGCDNPMELDECAAVFRSLQNDFYEEYVMYDLSSLAVALVFPLVCTLDQYKFTMCMYR